MPKGMVRPPPPKRRIVLGEGGIPIPVTSHTSSTWIRLSRRLGLSKRWQFYCVLLTLFVLMFWRFRSGGGPPQQEDSELVGSDDQLENGRHDGHERGTEERLTDAGWQIPNPSTFVGDDPPTTLAQLAQTFPYSHHIASPNSAIEATLSALHIYKTLGKNGGFIPHTAIPRIIHQTWKTNDLGNAPGHVGESVRSWRGQNKVVTSGLGFAHILWSDNDMDEMVAKYHPTLYPVFKGLPKNVLRADIFRYLVLLSFGGVYADVDTFVLRPVEKWLDQRDLASWKYKDKMMPAVQTVNFMVGVETDVEPDNEVDWRPIYQTPLQMCQWTMASTANHPILTRTIHTIFDHLASMTPVEIQNADVPRLTGPAPWTYAIYAHMSENGIAWEDLRDWGENARAIADVVILPITAFAPGYGEVLITVFGKMGSKSIHDPDARVRHMWRGVWRQE